MSESEDVCYRALSELVSQVDAKITARKDPTRPYVGLENIPSHGAHLTGWFAASSSISTNSIFQTGDVLFGKLRPNLRKCVVAPFDGYCSTDILVLRANTGVDPSFAGKVLRTEQVGGAAEMTSVGTKMPRTSWKHLSELEVFCPGFSEQSKIAKVLDTLDTAIHETEAIIAKLKAVKQGLLHDLLTRGIDANGELRPTQSEAPHLYKQSPLGWIPKEWACKPFGGLCESSAFGPRFPSGAYDENGPLATLRTTDMDDEGNISPSTMPRAAIAPSAFADHLLRPGDLVISRSGTCGVTGVFSGHDIPVVPGAFLIRFRMRDLRLNRFYRRYFNSAQGRPYLDRLAVGGVQKNIKGSDVLCILVPVPSPQEAVGIAERVESVEHDIANNHQLLTKLKLQKSGLMDDLLTGRVRVTPLLEDAAA
jgi:type I restriction enzyme S subunit